MQAHYSLLQVDASTKEILLRLKDTSECETDFGTTWKESWSTQDPIRLPVLSLFAVSVGVIVRNEEENIRNLLQSISEQRLEDMVIDEVIVVSSGSEDKTNELVLKYSSKDSRVRLVVQKRAEGKASGINEFLKMSRNEIVVVSSGDVIFNEKTLQNLITPLIKNRKIGLSSSRPIPINDAHSFMGTVANIHWRLHRLLERHGETIAFRKSLVDNIPEGISADEAYIEAVVRGEAFRAVQANGSLIFNKGSENTVEFLNQIRRHYAGHLFIRTKLSYLVSSMTIGGYMKIAKELLKCLCEKPSKASYIVGFVFLEAAGRLLGIWDFYIKKRYYRVWSAAQTTKILTKKQISWSVK